MRTATPHLVRGEKPDEEGKELEEGEIPAEQGSDSGSVRTSEGSQTTISTVGQGESSPSTPLVHEAGPSSTNQGDLERCQEIDLKILCSVVTPFHSSSSSCQQIAEKGYAYATGWSAGPAGSLNELNYIVPGACEHYQERRKNDLTQQKEYKNEVKMRRGYLKHVTPRAAGEPPGDVVCRNSKKFDLNLLPDMDEDQDDDHQGEMTESSTTNTTATKHLLQTPNRVSAFSPYVSSSRSPMPGVQKPAHLDSQSFRSYQPAMAPPHTQAPGASRTRPPLPPGFVLSMNAAPSVFRSMVAAVALPPANNHGRKRLVAAAGPPIIEPPFMARRRGPSFVQPPARLFVNYGTEQPQIMQEQQQMGTPTVRQQRQQTLQLFPKSS
ncbi:uncharacterized protein LOC126409826 [Nymphaea colorata]|nr:uncharacterized protein LOC126409826 [Nymphaea colorata]